MSRIKHTLYIGTFGIILLTLFWPPCTIFAQDTPDPCNSNLYVQQAPVKDPLSYTLREDRCEGVYIQETSVTLQVVSLIESFEDFDLQSEQELIVEWTVPKAQQVQLRAHGLQSGLHYQMDTIRPASDTTYRWPINILQDLGITRRDLGVVGWARYAFSGTNRDVYLPLQISQQHPPEQSTQYRVILWSWRELSEVFVSVATVNADGAPDEFIQDGMPLGYGYYPAGRGIEFALFKPEKPGIYYLEIGATLSKGGVVTIEHWFYHAG